MPVIINAEEKHPFLPLPGDTSAIDLYRALHQDIRPLEILVTNLMADKIGTERQLAAWLGDTEVQVHLTFAATDDYIDSLEAGRITHHTPSAHIEKFYSRFSHVKGHKYDGLIITGVNALEQDITKDPLWPRVQEILDWSSTNAVASLFLCWGAQAALKHFYGIDRHRSAQKTWGLFDHRKGNDKAGLLAGFPDRFPVPVSRWNEIRADDVEAHTALELTMQSEEAGVGLVVEPRLYDDNRHYYAYRTYVFNHPEYDTETLLTEYQRDTVKNQDRVAATKVLPNHYFPNNDPEQAPVNTWRHTGRLYANWVRSVYHATPFDIRLAPEPYRRDERVSLSQVA